MGRLCKSAEPNGFISSIESDDKGNIYYVKSREGLYRLNRKESNSKVCLLTFKKDVRGIVWNQNNNVLYMCDLESNQILQYDIASNKLSTLCGTKAQKNSSQKNQDGDFSQASFAGPNAGSDDSVKWNPPTHRDGEASLADFYTPSDIAVAPENTLYVADYNNHCIRKILNGIVSTVAGIPCKWGKEDGNTTTAKLYSPYNVTLHADGYLLVSDYESLRIVDQKSSIHNLSTDEGCKQPCKVFCYQV